MKTFLICFILTCCYFDIYTHSQGNKTIESLSFLSYCKYTHEHPVRFKRFRKNSKHFDTTSYTQGQYYLNYLETFHPNLLKKISIFKDNDTIGNPLLCNYSLVKKICPETLKYTKITSDIETLFYKNKPLKIAEIDAGYGGLCRILLMHLPIESYHIIGFPENLQLIQKYLKCFNLPHEKIQYINYAKITESQNYDVIIGHTTFFTQKKKLQLSCLNKIIQHAHHGYFSTVILPSEQYQSFSLYNLQQFLMQKNLQIILTNEQKNYQLLFW